MLKIFIISALNKGEPFQFEIALATHLEIVDTFPKVQAYYLFDCLNYQFKKNIGCSDVDQFFKGSNWTITEMPEIWRDVVGYEGYYKVSSEGRIKSLIRRYKRSEQLKSLENTVNGYSKVDLWKNKIRVGLYVHRLVGIAFLANTDYTIWINHRNSIRTDNSLSNLEWVTPKQNVIHGIKFGNGNQKGSKNHSTKLTEENVLEIRGLLKNKEMSQKKIAEIFGVCQQVVSEINCRKIWKHVA
ncbi:MAG: NUMOD4 domain-containing protein [Bacteroidota bacterium]